MVMVPTALPELQLLPPVVCRQIRSPTARLAVVTVKVWSVAAVPFALKLPEWSAVPAEQATPLGAWFTATVAVEPFGTSTAPTIAFTVIA
jgi:hypothetical protein